MWERVREGAFGGKTCFKYGICQNELSRSTRTLTRYSR